MTDFVQFVRNEIEETLLRNCTFACLPLEKLSEIADHIEKLEAALREAIAIVAAHVPSGYPHLRKALEGKDD